MSKQLEQKELDQLKSLQDQFNQIVFKLGDINTQKLDVQSELDKLNEIEGKISSDYRMLRVNETQLVNNLIQKYGEGKINFETGEITE